MVSIHSKTDMKWMWKFAGKQSFWIGKQIKCFFRNRLNPECPVYKHTGVICAGLTGGPKQWSWTDGKLLTFSKLRKDDEEHASSAASCVLAQSQKIWIPKSCIDGSEHRYICSAPAQIS